MLNTWGWFRKCDDNLVYSVMFCEHMLFYKGKFKYIVLSAVIMWYEIGVYSSVASKLC